MVKKFLKKVFSKEKTYILNEEDLPKISSDEQKLKEIDFGKNNENKDITDPFQNHIINNNFASNGTNCNVKIPKQNENKVIADSYNLCIFYCVFIYYILLSVQPFC